MGLITTAGNLAAVAILGVRLAGFPGTPHAVALASAIAASCATLLFAAKASWSCIALAKAPL